jgi:hypothetical protein
VLVLLVYFTCGTTDVEHNERKKAILDKVSSWAIHRMTREAALGGFHIVD